MAFHPAVSQSMLVSRPSRLGIFLGVSVAGHGLLLVVGMLYSFLTSGPKVDPNIPVIKASLVRLGKPRDQKLLPRKEEPPPPPKEVKAPPAPPSAEPPKPPSPTAAPVLPAKPQPAPAPQKGDTSAEDRRKRLFGAFDKTAKKVPEDELEGAEDGDPSGDSATAEGERYYALLSSQVRRNYNVADTIPDAERMYLKALVQMRLGRAGEVIETKLTSASGNDLFDAAVLAAVKKASPFSPPPDHLRDSLQKQGIVLEFRP
ncbi:cell envelope integrity protein TolA [Hyalangium versicolor]|uniref:cell envelope integrity protein TolA n=1 Tax=Hyalangium versicolor TaxID=2861190 RepID=UPI001CCB0C74|nr:cell envelope integrity protein TolA [Hyalangium versicolor]